MKPHAAACTALLLLAACRASPPTRWFTLDPVAPAAPPVAGLAPVPPVRIDAVRLPAEFDRPELVDQTGAYAVTVHDLARWSAPVGQMACRVLTQDLLARLPAGAVIFPDAPKGADGAGLEVSILSLGRAGDRAVFDVSWTVSTARAPAAGRSPRRTLRLEVPAAAAGPDAVAAELSLLLAQLSDAIATDLTSGACCRTSPVPAFPAQG